jgi:hypothetical protein
VNSKIRRCARTSDAGDIDNFAALLAPNHNRNRRTGGRQHAVDIQIDMTPPAAFGLLKKAARRYPAGIINWDIDTSKMRIYSPNRYADRFTIHEIYAAK